MGSERKGISSEINRKLNADNQALPIDLSDYSLEDLELYCSCGHMINVHSEGLGGGISVCDENCGCVYCDFDFELSVMMHYFQGHYDNWLIVNMTTDAKRLWTMTNGGIPALKEPMQMIVTRRKK